MCYVNKSAQAKSDQFDLERSAPFLLLSLAEGVIIASSIYPFLLLQLSVLRSTLVSFVKRCDFYGTN